MKIHITNLHNIGGTATLAMDGVVQVAKKLDFTEMGVMKRQFYEDYWNTISHHLDGTIASLYQSLSSKVCKLILFFYGGQKLTSIFTLVEWQFFAIAISFI